MSHLLEQYRFVRDPVNQGMGALSLGLGMHLTRGLLFPWRWAGVALLRRTLYPTPSLWCYCGLVQLGATQIRNYAGFSHQANQAYHYAAAHFLGNGYVSRVSNPVRLDFDAGKNLVTPGLPAWPRNVTARPIAGGQFSLAWEYGAFGQSAYPKDFQVFAGADAGSVDYGTPLVDAVTGLPSVAYQAFRRAYTFTTAAYAHGAARVFVVRSRNSQGIAERNTNATAAQTAASVGPASAAVPIMAQVILHSKGSG